MFGFTKNQNQGAPESAAILGAFSKSQAMIEFEPDGTIITANDNFLNAMGYSLDEVQGKHHSIFVEPTYKESAEYKQFWEKLGRGEYQAGQYKRLGKGGREIWIEASYNPVFDQNGRPYKVVKIATDVTDQKMQFADLMGQVEAIGKSQAVIEFELDGTIRTANENFLGAVGYTLDEIKGKHHSMFVEPSYRESAEYKEFWKNLGSGKFQAGQYKRVRKDGQEIWLEASYNPIFDMNGKPFKVVKYATDITEQVELIANVKKLIDENIGEIDTSIERTSSEATNAASGATQTSSNVQTVASAVEELSASIKEISESITKSQKESEGAYEKTVNADESTQRLVESANNMNGIVEFINDIASQINLLALNATIESARAGDAGKGFAVVANEVKNLAKQASDATNKISTEIAGIQEVSNDVVGALGNIRQSIEAVREYVTNTASAVEEQSVVTNEISSNMQSASSAVADISGNIDQIVSAVETAKDAVDKTKEAALTLAK